jgi:general secretion pathway protein G
MAITVCSYARKGFSLMEMMVVIAIIGIITALIGPGINKAYKSVQKSSAKTTLQTMFKNGIEKYHRDTLKYPATLKDLIKRPKSGDERVTKKWDGPYVGDEGITEVPEDPWGEKFVYKVIPGGTPHPYELKSWGPNGKGSPKEEWIDVWEK